MEVCGVERLVRWIGCFLVKQGGAKDHRVEKNEDLEQEKRSSSQASGL